MANAIISLSKLSNRSADLTYKRGIVTVQFVNGATRAGKPWSFSLSEAAEFGQQVSKTGDWEGIPFHVKSATLRALGVEIKQFAESR